MHKRLLGCAVVAIAAMGCGDRAQKFDSAPNIVAKVALGNDLVFIDDASNMAHAVNLTTNEPQPKARRIPLPASPSYASLRPGHPDELLVTCNGSLDQYGDIVEPPSLNVIANHSLERGYELSSRYESTVWSDDGQYALFWASAQDEFLSTPDQVTLVDLDQEQGSANPYDRQLSEVGGSLGQAFLIPPLSVSNRERSLALFVFPGGMSFWDLSRPERHEVTATSHANGAFSVARVVADPVESKLYLLVRNSTDLWVVSLTAPDDPAAQNDFRPSINQLGLGTQVPSDLLVFGTGSGQRLLTVGGASLAVVASDDNQVTTIALPTTADSLTSFEGTAPGDSTSRTRVLAYGVGMGAVSFVDLEDLEIRTTRNIESVNLGHPLSRVVPLGNNELLMVFSDAAIGVLSLESRRFRPLIASVGLGDSRPTPSEGRVWVAPPGTERVGYFDADSLESGEIRLDRPIDQMFLFGTGSSQRVVVTHPSLLGTLTYFDARTPTRDHSRTLEGFLAEGIVYR